MVRGYRIIGQAFDLVQLDEPPKRRLIG
jgi:hypothetical protein